MELKKEKIINAYALGEEVLDDIVDIIEVLEEAKGWGLADMLFSKSWITVAMKHSNIDKSKSMATSLNIKIKELSNLLENTEVGFAEIDLSNLYTIMDIFHNGLMLDIVIQDKLTKNIDLLKELSIEINHILYELRGVYEENF